MASTNPHDIGNLAKWSVSSRKFGFGLQHLRDGNEETFWQSEGPVPHNIDVAFSRKVYVSAVHICLSHPNDDSYTPEKISIFLGTSHYDLVEVANLHLVKPDGWTAYPLRPESKPKHEGQPMGPNEGQEEGPPLPAFHVRIQITANHLNGKDTHVRGIRVFGVPGTAYSTALPLPTDQGLTTQLRPVPPTDGALKTSRRPIEIAADNEAIRMMEGGDGLEDFTTLEFKMHQIVR